jgi:hypothetical protein
VLLAFAALPAAAQSIDPHAIAAHMRFLASDALEGRETGSRGFEIAAAYVRAQFEAAGLEASYQPLRLRAAKLDESASSLAIGGKALVIRKDFLMRPDFERESVDARAAVVLAGFGVTAPELAYDDYRGVDAGGKIVFLISGAPKTFPIDQRAYYSSTDFKRRNAAAHGAAGIITLSSITDEARNPFEKRAQQSGITPMALLDPSGKPADVIAALRVSATLNRAAAEMLFAGAPMTLDTILADAEKGIGHSFALQPSLAAHTVSSFAEAKSENVIGMLRGNEETVVLSAHLDHLGNHPSVAAVASAAVADGIYNGAYDNASGIAILIEVAKAMAKGPKPKRAVMFVALTGEEKGIQGSTFLAKFPPVPKRSIVADINMDMILMLYPFADVVPLGGEHTSLGPLAASAAKASGFEVSPDPYPEEVRFIRSDQFAFVEAGIPAIHIKPGNKSRDRSIDGAKVTRDWLRGVYHTVHDEMSQPIDFASGARYAEMSLRLARAVADGPRPEWVAGDFFAKTFAGGGRKATITLRVP